MGHSLTWVSGNSKTGEMRVVVEARNLPAFLLSAKAAIEAGDMKQAAELLNDEAIEQVNQMLNRDSSRTDIMFMLGLMFDRIGLLGKAERWYRKVIEHEPNASAFRCLANICKRSHRLLEAIEYQRQSVRMDPDNARFLSCLGVYLINAGRTQEGLGVLRRAMEKEPQVSDIHSKLLFHLHYLPDLDPNMLLTEHRQWGRLHAPVSLARKSHDNIPDPDRRLRIGYVSADFRRHSVAYNFEAFLSKRDTDEVEVYGYGNVYRPDDVTGRLKLQFDHYRDIWGLEDHKVAHLVEQDEIDILVEIGGHTRDNRLGVLAYKPAPVQISYGDLSTSGIEQIDYRLTDALLDQPENDKFYIEESVCLPGGLFCYCPPNYAPPVAALPALRNGFLTYGSFNNNMKINSFVISLWAQVLKTNENSRLLLKYPGGDDAGVGDLYLSEFEKAGIARDRVEIHGWKPSCEHMELYNKVDIVLDTYPFNGCVTTLEGLWMGVPAISLMGKSSLLSRVGLSILSRIGLESFVAHSPAAFVAKATAFTAGNIDALARIRATMRTRMSASTLCNPERFARELEDVYRKIWRKWCRDKNHQGSDSDISGRTMANAREET